MKAVIFFGPREIRLVDVPIPHPGPGEVLIRVGAALTCGTDFKAYRQGHKVLLGDPPAPFGHELAGTVVEAGPGAERFTPGTRVVAANSAPCDRCFYCGRGQSQLCENLKLHNGAYAEYNLIPAHIVRHNLYPLEPSVDFRTAALAEPLACALHAVDVMRVEQGETAAILGAGNMALFLLQALRDRGARALVIGRGRERLELARRAGAAEAVSALEVSAVDAAKSWSAGPGPDCVFEAVGMPQTWEQAVAIARKGGRVCLFGGCAAGARVPLDAHRIHYEQIGLQGVFHHTPRYFREAVDLLSRGRVDPRLFIAGDIPLSETPAFFAQAHDKSNPKVAVIP